MQPKILLDTHELAWAAGFIDGEGYFKFTKDKHGYVGIALARNVLVRAREER